MSVAMATQFVQFSGQQPQETNRQGGGILQLSSFLIIPGPLSAGSIGTGTCPGDCGIPEKCPDGP
jgi:hypothetical protein